MSDFTCPVCFEITTDVLHECGHSLCHVCASKWLASHDTCPTCRSTLQESLRTVRKKQDWLQELPDLSFSPQYRIRQVHFWVPALTRVSYTLRTLKGNLYACILSSLGIDWSEYEHLPPSLSNHFLQGGNIITHIDGARIVEVSEISDRLNEAIATGEHLHVGILDVENTNNNNAINNNRTVTYTNRSRTPISRSRTSIVFNNRISTNSIWGELHPLQTQHSSFGAVPFFSSRLNSHNSEWRYLIC